MESSGREDEREGIEEITGGFEDTKENVEHLEREVNEQERQETQGGPATGPRPASGSLKGKQCPACNPNPRSRYEDAEGLRGSWRVCFVGDCQSRNAPLASDTLCSSANDASVVRGVGNTLRMERTYRKRENEYPTLYLLMHLLGVVADTIVRTAVSSTRASAVS